VDAAWNGWQVKRKGRALRLRLAKNRFLQLASDPSFPKAALSPLSLDSDSTEGNSHDWDTNDFEANGMIWAELPRQVPISAMAMSRSYLDLPLSTATPRPLLMALGDESGMVTVTEIIDGHQSQRRNGSGRKFGESLEFQMQGRIRCIDFAPNDQSILVGGDGCVAVFLLIVVDTVTLELQELRVLWQVECVDRIYSVQFDPLGSCLSVAGFDGKIALYSTEGLLQPNPPTTTEILRRGLIYCLDWHPSGSFFAVGGSDNLCVIYGKDCKLVHEVSFSGALQTLKWNPDGMYLAIAIRGEVAILDGAQYTVKCELSNAPDKSSRYRVEDLCWSPDGSFLAIGGSDGICLVIETKTYALVHEVHRPSQILCLSWGQLVASNECYRYLAISDHDSCVALVKAGIESDGSEVDETVSMASSAYFSTASETNWILREDSFKDMDDCPTELPCDIMPRGTVTAVAFSRASKSKGSSYLAYAADDCSLTIMTTRNWRVVFVSRNHMATESGISVSSH
jgi:WD40 repeat protein